MLWPTVIIFLIAAQPVHADGFLKERLKERLEERLGSGKPLIPGDVKITLQYDGRQRYYLVHVPPGYDNNTPTPMVFVIHGGGGNPAQIEAQVDFTPLSDRDNILLVYPAGSSGAFDDVLLTWNTGFTDTYADKQNFNDVGFLLKVLDDVSSRYNIDRKRVYATGMSQGAFMSYHLACEAADKITAVAPVAGSFAVDSCHPSVPVSVMAFMGLNDGFVRYNGQPGKHVIKPHASARDALAFWVQKDGLSKTPPKREQIRHAELEVYGPGTDGVEAGLWTLTDAGHGWPGKHGERKQAEKSNMDISATEIIWEFFKRHSRP
jgi:polyhydroxybutyrate depolymerase